jgi:uncharacterized protein YkwD
MLRSSLLSPAAALSATLLSAAALLTPTTALASTKHHRPTTRHAPRHVVHKRARRVVHHVSVAAPAPQTAPAVVQACADAQTPVAGAAPAALRAAVVCLVNNERGANGLPALVESTRLDSASQGWSDTMVATNVFAHVTSSSNPVTRIEATGYGWLALGENIATGFETPQSVVKAWMASPEHCHNILDPQYRDVGTGVNANPVTGFANGLATWTQDFGLAAGADTPSDNWSPANTICH